MSSESGDMMLQVYRHDAHKFFNRHHNNALDTVAGVSVNEDVPYGADGDAAAMSRPSGKQDGNGGNGAKHFRRSLLTGAEVVETEQVTPSALRPQVHDLLATADAQAMHRRWLSDAPPIYFNEWEIYPYTSLRYHTLIAAALVANYRDGHDFEDLHLCVTDGVVPHRTIYDGRFRLSILPDPVGGPNARLGASPWRNWHGVWGRMTDHPLDTESNRFDMQLDASLRRIRAWSTALQFIEDYEAFREGAT